jgi:hypothetical protein
MAIERSLAIPIASLHLHLQLSRTDSLHNVAAARLAAGEALQ